MLSYVTGDILLSGAAAIAHGVAPNDDFKQGLALALRERWPGMYKDFRHYCQTFSPKAGGVWSWKGPDSPVIVCLFTQDASPEHRGHPGKATIPNVNHALHELKKEIVAKEIGSLAMPRLATGVGELKWDEVRALLERDLKDVAIPIYVYETYKKDVSAPGA